MSSLIPQNYRSSCKVACALGVPHPVRLICSLILIASLWPTASVAQITRDDAHPRRNPDEPQLSAAHRAADAAVAFSPEIIIDTLRHEPGLLLQVKKVLVEKAYEQGRLLDPEDLTDDVLFHLIRDDQKIRILATREMENRGYIRVKPTIEEQKEQRELERRWRQLEGAQGSEPAQPAQPQQGTDQRRTLRTDQEDDYYARHEPLPYVPPSQAQPRQQFPERQPLPNYDQSQPQQQRRQDRASLNAGPPPDTDVPQMARVRPDDLSGILPEQSVETPTLAADRGAEPEVRAVRRTSGQPAFGGCVWIASRGIFAAADHRARRLEPARLWPSYARARAEVRAAADPASPESLRRRSIALRYLCAGGAAFAGDGPLWQRHLSSMAPVTPTNFPWTCRQAPITCSVREMA